MATISQNLLNLFLASGVEARERVFTDTIIGTNLNLEAGGFERKISTTGKKQLVATTPDNKEIIVNVSDYKETYTVIKRTANIDYKTMKAGDYFIIGI
jgi:hypothetical protein